METPDASPGGEDPAPPKRPRSLQRENLVFIPSTGRLPPPEVLALYASIDPEYPAFLRKTLSVELKRNFIYQMATWIGAILFALVLVGSATFLTYTGHPKMASAVVGVNLLGIVGKLLAKSKRENEQ